MENFASFAGLPVTSSSISAAPWRKGKLTQPSQVMEILMRHDNVPNFGMYRETEIYRISESI